MYLDATANIRNDGPMLHKETSSLLKRARTRLREGGGPSEQVM